MLSYTVDASPIQMMEMRSFFCNAAGCRLFFNERDSDVAIRVEWEGLKWHFPAHRLILCTMSEVFRIMLETDMLEKSTSVITIKDSNPLTVKQLLKYLYMGIMDFHGWTEAVNLLKISHKYGVQPLISLCESQLISHIAFSNVCVLYEVAQTYSLKLLQKESQNFILDTGFIVSATEGFFNLKPPSLEYFLSNPQFNMEEEVTILTSLREWAVCDCSRKGILLSWANILSSMEPFMKYIRWDSIPEHKRTFVPYDLVEKHRPGMSNRKHFSVPSSLQYHVNTLKFVVELGTFYESKEANGKGGLNCLKFGVGNHAFVAGFRIVGMFKHNSGPSGGYSSLILGKEDASLLFQFNLNSLPWTKGASVDQYTWREMIAYLPHPIRVDPFSVYFLNLKCGNRTFCDVSAKWPRTRLENGLINTDLGSILFTSYGSCYGITQLFMLPAPPSRSSCNVDPWRVGPVSN